MTSDDKEREEKEDEQTRGAWRKGERTVKAERER